MCLVSGESQIWERVFVVFVVDGGKLVLLIRAARVYVDATAVCIVVSGREAAGEITKQFSSYLKSSNFLNTLKTSKLFTSSVPCGR